VEKFEEIITWKLHSRKSRSGRGEKLEEIATWRKDVESRIAAVNEDIVYLSKCLDECEQTEIDKV
jgi:hypothetical protein